MFNLIHFCYKLFLTLGKKQRHIRQICDQLCGKKDVNAYVEILAMPSQCGVVELEKVRITVVEYIKSHFLKNPASLIFIFVK